MVSRRSILAGTPADPRVVAVELPGKAEPSEARPMNALRTRLLTPAAALISGGAVVVLLALGWAWLTLSVEGGAAALVGAEQPYVCGADGPGGEWALPSSQFFVATQGAVVGGDAVSLPYRYFLYAMSFFMGLGKGGVPGSSTSSMALNSLLAPEGCITFAIALVVPATFMTDLAAVATYYRHARVDLVQRLLPPTVVGVVAGTQLLGTVSASQAKLLIGGALGTILTINLTQAAASYWGRRTLRNAEQIDDRPPPYASSIWFASVVGLLGGFATILTNSMGPLLNVFLLALRLDPKTFVGTRSLFFTVINSIKVFAQMRAGNLDHRLLAVSVLQGVAAVVGVACAKLVVNRLSKPLFMTLEYCLMTVAAARLISSGLSEL